MNKAFFGLALAVLFVSFFSSAGSAREADLPPYFSPLSFPAQPLPWTAEATADFGALLEHLGAGTGLDPASVRVTLADGTALPARFIPDKGATDRGLVRWSVPAVTNSQTLEFKICFGPQASLKSMWKTVVGWFESKLGFVRKSGQDCRESDNDAIPAPNLLPNGSFEILEADGKKIKYWPFNPDMNEVITDPQQAHLGRTCIKVKACQNPNDKRWHSYVHTPGKPGVVVEGGKCYSFRFWIRDSRCSTAVYWYRADGSYILHEGFSGEPGPDGAWAEVSKSFQAPPDARFAMHYPSFYASKGVMYMDDFSIWLTQAPQLSSAQSADGTRKVALGITAPGVKRFDCGPEKAEVWASFDAVTPKTAYTNERGFGWIGAARPAAVARDLPDNLARTCVIGPSCRFAVDLPDGEYKVWLLIGDSGLGESIIPTHVNWSVKSGDQELLGYHPDARSWYEKIVFRNFNDWWSPDVDVYERFIAPQYQEQTIPLTVKGGQAQLEFDGVPLGALVIYPAALETEMRKELARLRSDRKRAVAVSRVSPPREAPVGLAAADQKRGYALFAPPVSREIFPTSAPQQGEVTTKLGAFAAPGEMKAITFAIYPLRDLGDVSVTVSDLKSAAGILPPSAVEVAVVRYVERMLDTKEYRYDVQPSFIQPRNPMPVAKDMTVRWWLRLRVPRDAKPGDYAGKVSIAPARGRAAEIELSVRILPIELGPTPIIAGLYHLDRTYWYIYWWRHCFEDKDGWLRQQTLQHERDDFALLKEFGLNSLSFCEDNRGMTWDGNQWVFSADDRFTVWMDLYKEAGMGPMPWYGFCGLSDAYLQNGTYTPGRTNLLEQFTPEWEQAYCGMIAWTSETQRKHVWPEVIFYVSDELSNDGAKGAERGRKYVQMTKDIPGIRTIASMNGPFEKVMLPGLKIAMPNHAFPINNETVSEIRRNGCELWIYNCGCSRVMWGLYLWKMGARGRFQWYHRYVTCEPWNAFDGDNHYTVTGITPGKPLPSPALWEIAGGLTDLRYLEALEKAISEAQISGKPAAVKAAEAGQKALAALRDLVPDEARLLTGDMDPREAGKPAIGRLADSRFLDEQRQIIANHIVNIQSALR